MNLRETLIARLAAERALPPTTVPALNFELVLIAEGLFDEVNAFIATTPPEVQVSWRRATVIEANSPLLLGAAQAMGKDQAFIDDLLIKARDIKKTHTTP